MNQPPSFEERWRQRFEKFAGANDDDAGIAGWSVHGLDTRFRNFVHAFGEPHASASPWLDAGCGAGTYTRFLEQHGLSVAAVDYSVPSLIKARQRGNGSTRWAAADVGKLPFRDGSFDGALCFGVMQALAAPDAALRELRRVLRPGAWLWIDALNGRCWPTLASELLRRARGRAVHLRYDVPARFVAAARAAGFDEIQVHWVPVMPGRFRAAQPAVEAPFTRRLLAALPLLGSGISHSFMVAARASQLVAPEGGTP